MYHGKYTLTPAPLFWRGRGGIVMPFWCNVSGRISEPCFERKALLVADIQFDAVDREGRSWCGYRNVKPNGYSRTCWSKTSEFWSTFDQPAKEDEARQRSEQQGRTIIHHKIALLSYRAAQVIVANRIMEIGDMGIWSEFPLHCRCLNGNELQRIGLSWWHFLDRRLLSGPLNYEGVRLLLRDRTTVVVISTSYNSLPNQSEA